MKAAHRWITGLFASLALSAAVDAGPLPTYPLPFDPTTYLSNGGCVSYGDFISCSLGMLNYLNGLDVGQTTTDTPTGYIIAIPQGYLDQVLVLGTGAGGTPSLNTDLSPTGIDNAYDTPNAPALWSTTTTPDPAPTFPGDNSLTWDITVSNLTSLLTSDDTFHELAIGFDHNQTGASETIDVWAVVTLVDLENSANNKSFELTPNPIGYAAYNTSYDAFYTGNIDASQFIHSFAYICVDTLNSTITPQNTACPNDPNIVEVKNNLGTNEAEFMAFIPELSQLLLACAIGPCPYDVVSVQYRFMGANDGYEDLFVIAGAPMQRVPEPGTLGIMGLALLALALARRRFA